MDEKLKRRLVGVAVLAVLAIIFVPMVLDGPNWSEPQSPTDQSPNDVVADEQNVRVRLQPDPANDSIVEMPASTAGSSSRNSEQSDGSRAASSVPNRTTTRIAPSTVTASSSNNSTSSTTTSRAQAETAARRQEAGQNRQARQASTSPAASAAATIDGQGHHGVSGQFLIQVGSFSSEANAKRLVQRLIAKGWPAYHDQWQGRDRVLQRVRIGPLDSRDQADQLAKKVAESQRVKPRVMQID